MTLLIAAATGLGSDLKIGLNTAIIAPSKTLILSDMTEPTYTGYARQSVVFTSASRDSTYDIVAEGDVNAFAMSGTPVPTLVQGWFLIFGAGPSFLGYCPLPQPYQMNDALDVLSIVVQYIQSCTPQGTATVII